MTLHLVSVFPSFRHTSADMSALQMDYSFKSMLCDFNTQCPGKWYQLLYVKMCWVHIPCYQYYSNQHCSDFWSSVLQQLSVLTASKHNVLQQANSPSGSRAILPPAVAPSISHQVIDKNGIDFRVRLRPSSNNWIPSNSRRMQKLHSSR